MPTTPSAFDRLSDRRHLWKHGDLADDIHAALARGRELERRVAEAVAECVRHSGDYDKHTDYSCGYADCAHRIARILQPQEPTP